MSLSRHEEDYLKCLLHQLPTPEADMIGTNLVASSMGITPASANSMLKKLRGKDLVNYARHGQWSLTGEGRSLAIRLFRKHRLWETFLFHHLKFDDSEVHDIAEQLEHIQSAALIDRLDEFLGFPTRDPHGESIPNADGSWRK